MFARLLDRAAAPLLFLLLSLCVLLPLAELVLRADQLSAPSAIAAPLDWSALIAPTLSSLRLSLASALVATVLGGSYALILAWGRPPAPKLWLALGLLPIAPPPFLLALAIVTAFAPDAAGIGLSGQWVYHWTTAALVLGVASAPLVMAPVSLAAAQLHQNPIDALRLARGPRAAWLWQLRSLRPAFALGAALSFTFCLSRFSAPQLLRVPVLTELVYSRFQDLRDLSGAMRAMTPLLLLSILGASLAASWARASDFAMPRAETHERRGGAAPTLAALALFALLIPGLIGPLWVNFSAWLHSAEARSGSAMSLLRTCIDDCYWRSCLTAALSALILTALAAFASLAAPRALLSTRSLALLLSLTAIPGPVLGIGLVLFWNRPGAFWRAIYDSAFMGGLAQVASFAPLIIVLGAVLAARHPPAEDEACRLAGATPLALGGRLRSLLAISALAMAWSMGEYGASSLVSAPGYGLLSARLIGLMHFGRNGETAVLSVLLSLSCAIPALLLGLASALTPSAPQETERP